MSYHHDHLETAWRMGGDRLLDLQPEHLDRLAVLTLNSGRPGRRGPHLREDIAEAQRQIEALRGTLIAALTEERFGSPSQAGH